MSVAGSIRSPVERTPALRTRLARTRLRRGPMPSREKPTRSEGRIRWRSGALVLVFGVFGTEGCAKVAPALANVALATAATVGENTVERRTAERRLEAMQPSRPGRARRDASRRPVTSVVRLQVYASEDHRAEIVDAERGFREAVQRANEILDDNNLRVRFAIAGFNRWARRSTEVSTSVLLDELERVDAGAEGELVVGLIGRLSVADNFSVDKVGVARYLGHHVLVRALAADAADEVEASAPHASPAALAAASRAERLHIVALVLLHEWAHTLGAIHSLADRSIMTPTYRRTDDVFDDTTREIVKLMRPCTASDEGNTRAERLAGLREIIAAAPPETTVPAEVERVRRMLETAAPTPAATDHGATTTFRADVGRLPDLVLMRDHLSLDPYVQLIRVMLERYPYRAAASR